MVSPDTFGVNLHGRVTVRWGTPIASSAADDDDVVDGLMLRVREALLALQAESGG